MAGSVTVTLTESCDSHGAGGAHVTFSVTGAKEMTINGMMGELLGPMDDDEARIFVKGLIKLAKIGRTNAQVKALFEAGVTVTI